MSEETPITPRARKLAGIARWALVVAFAALAALGAAIGAGVIGGGDAIPYTCPMHAQIVNDGPGSCPICGMDLVPQAASNTHTTSTAHTTNVTPADSPPGTVHVTTAQARGVGVVTVAARMQPLTRRIRAPGRVDADANAVSIVDVRLPGWLSGLTVRSVGEEVRRGALLATLTSPQLFDAESELVAARRAAAALGTSGEPFLEAARARLAALGVPASEVARVSNGGAASTRLAIRAPRNGVVVALDASDGAYVGPGSALFTIADLSRLAVVADLAESDAGALGVGSAVRVALASKPERSIAGHVVLLAPTVDAARRTRSVRVALDDAAASGALVPGSAVWLDAELATRSVLVVPRDAVLSGATSTRVFVDAGGGHFAPRTVELGVELDELVEITSGLRDGERVAAVGAFLLDAESRFHTGAP